MCSLWKFSRAFIVFICLTAIEVVDFGFNPLEGIPVVVIHAGGVLKRRPKTDYVLDCLWQAEQYNDEVILLGDASNCDYPFAKHHYMSDYFQEAGKFAKIYKHKSSNRYKYELICFQRWFVLKEFMEKNGIEECFHCDSDFMLYCDVTELSDRYRPFDVVMIHRDTNCSGHCAYFNLKGIRKTCEFFTHFFVKFNKYNKKYKLISDMYALKELADSTPSNELMIIDINQSPENGVFDGSMRFSYGVYSMKKFSKKTRLKDVHWIKNQPQVYNEFRQSWDRFNGLHFQGNSKKFMKQHRRKRLIH